ncbi:MAG: hypothetical protein Q4F72_12685, partial [Desulfovibrionaceae bacterium]|nr:hypothetical protein [Desulfovibrionaceae bacterium]
YIPTRPHYIALTGQTVKRGTTQFLTRPPSGQPGTAPKENENSRKKQFFHKITVVLTVDRDFSTC